MGCPRVNLQSRCPSGGDLFHFAPRGGRDVGSNDKGQSKRVTVQDGRPENWEEVDTTNDRVRVGRHCKQGGLGPCSVRSQFWTIGRSRGRF